VDKEKITLIFGKTCSPMAAILITGYPGVGKTTCIREIARSLEELHPAGFYTRELRESGIRVGFEIVGLDGSQRLLAHTGISSRYRVGKYFVDVEGFEEFLRSLTVPEEKNSVIIIDEIGKMECLSPLFRDLINRILDYHGLLIATIARSGDPFIEAIKKREDVVLYTMTRENRDGLPVTILETVTDMMELPPL
jgi:nucleoside-triphosphatase